MGDHEMQSIEYYDGRGRLYELPAAEHLDGVVDDLAKARHALNAAWRLYDKIDLPKVVNKMQALDRDQDLDKERNLWHLQRIQDAKDKITKIEEELRAFESSMITRARAAVSRAEQASLGEMRGELLRDAGGAHNALARAREVLSHVLISQQMGSDDRMLREGLDVARLQKVACEQSGRLLEESANLIKHAYSKVEAWDTVDALLGYKSAKEKLARANVTALDMKGKFLGPLILERGVFQDNWWPGTSNTLAETAHDSMGRLQVPTFEGIDRRER